MRKRLILALTSVAVLAGMAATPAAAGCSGFGCNLVQGIPVIGPAAQAVDDGIRGFKDRGSDADFLHQATGLQSWNNPIGQPAAPPPPPLGNRCATMVGAFFGPWNPVGAPCRADVPGGPFLIQ
jgi:hypothetical protein